MSSILNPARIFLLVSLLFLSGTSCHAADQVMEFSWAVLQDTPQGQIALDFLQPEPLDDGTALQLFLEQTPGVYIYIYLLDSKGSLEVLFPGEPAYYDRNKPDGSIIRVPPGTGRFVLTPPPGQEKLYLLASAGRLERLEQLTGEYLDRPADPKSMAAVLQEMKKLRRQHSQLSQLTETSVPVAGTVRSGEEKTDTFKVTRVRADTFYSRILHLQHE